MIQLRRALVFLLGIFIMALGVALTVRANLGTAPVTSLPTVLSFATPLTVGTITILLNLIFLLLSIILLRRRFPPIQLIQLPVTVLFGLFIDFHMTWTWWLDPGNYLIQWLWTILGSVLVGLGVYIEVQPKLTYIPGDGLVTVITRLSKIPFGTVKVWFDWSLVVLAVISSLLLLGGLEGVREGTVFAAFAVGFVVRALGNLHTRWRAARNAD